MLKVLVVDDDQGLRLSVKSALVSSNRFSVDEAFDGINALEKYEAANPKHDIVILDVDMPRLNGLETLKRLKEKDPGLIVIMLTANAGENHRREALAAGADMHLVKPVSQAAIGDALRAALAIAPRDAHKRTSR